MIRSRSLVGPANLLILAAVAGLLILSAAVVRNLFDAAQTARLLSQRSYAVLGAIKDLDLAMRNAETGQRGYLLTGKEDYLAPYNAASARVGALQDDMLRLTDDNPELQSQARALAPIIQHKLQELGQTIALRRAGALEPAIGVVNTDVGRDDMRRIEASLSDMLAREQSQLFVRTAALEARSSAVRSASFAGVVVAILALLGAAWLLNLAWTRAARLEDEQRALAARLRTVLDSITQGVGVFDAELRLIECNHCFGHLLDLPDVLVQTGTPYTAMAAQLGDEASPFLETIPQIQAARRTGTQATQYERVIGERHLEVRRTPMHVPHTAGSIHSADGIVLTVSDMTKRAEAEAVVREAQKMQAIGQLTGGIAHDFNNLLTVILGNLEFARVKLTPDQSGLQARLDRAVWAAQRGATLTSQLLAFARRQPLAPSAISLSSVMPDVVPLLQRTLGEQIEVRFVDAAALWPAMADRAQFESAMLNLALNARDAMPGGGRLTIELANKVLDAEYARAHAEVQPGDYTMVAVSDTGIGMAPDVLARVFEPFFTTKLDGRGTGLGLAMVFGFAKQSGGHIKIYSEPQHGTTVRLYLPRAIAAPSAVAQRLDRPVEVPRGNATVLLVEDEAAVREIAVAILRDLGYRVLEAGDGDDALRVFGTEAARIDLLLTDVVLPGRLRGRDLAERIVAIRPQIRVLFMSGYTENAIVHHGRLDDGVHLISKPFQREQLAQKVAEVLGAQPAGDGANVVDLRR